MYFEQANYTLKVTNDCFMRCDYCMVQDEFEDNQMETETFQHLTRLSKGFNRLYYIIMGGEPLMLPPEYFDKNLAVLDNAAKERKQLAQYSVNTNGVKLNDEYIRVFKKYNVGIMISFDGLGHGPKGIPKILEKIKKYSKDILMVTITVSHNNALDLVNIHKQMEEAGVRRYNVMYDFYADDQLCEKMIAGTNTLQKYLQENRSKTRNITLDNIKSLAKYGHSGMNTDMQFGNNHTLSDICVQPDGTLEPYVMYFDGYNLGNISEYEHMLDISTHPEMIKHAKQYIDSLDVIDPFVQLLKGGNYWGREATGDYTKPNMKMINMFKKMIQFHV